MRTLIAISLVLAGGAITACGGGSGDPAASTLSEEEWTAEARVAAESALLTLADLPEGWSGTAQDPTDDDWVADVQPSPECALITEEAEFPGSVHEAESEEFDLEEDEDVSTTVGVYRTGDAANMGEGAFKHFIENCTDDFIAMFKEYAQRESPEYGWDLTLDRFDAGEHGDWSEGQVMTMTILPPGGDPVTLVYRSLSVRQGRVMGTLYWGETDAVDDALIASLTQTFVERLAAADAALPS